MKRDQEHFRGCLLGGAIGDALGWPVEFMKLDEIVQRFGEGGIRDLILAPSGKAEITDDTQMTVFTAEGLLRAEARGVNKGICHLPSVVFHAYQRWLLTQGYPRKEEYEGIYDGWLLGVKELHAPRAPGKTCISALLSGRQGSMESPINNSKGCGGVMRVAPVGLFCRKEDAFRTGAEIAALTHGHPSGYLSAGALAYLVASIIEGRELESAVEEALAELAGYENHEECSAALAKAVELARVDSLGDAEAIARLGEGWVGEEALAIAVYCALKHRDDFRKALIAAVNHDGDSDSTGAIAGNILGVYLGLSGIPTDWVEQVELKEVLLELADDLLTRYRDDEAWRCRYPGC
ncbi:MAG TPA: ADP-ribosylglycohydrolase family protein [Bacillota bacterium]|nr:ADP-ribosylglycohydrolase family protein [Bacillota bacterium]